MKFPNLSQAEILAISKALADTEYGFTGSELEVLLKQYDFADENPTMTKYKRLYNSFVERYNREKSCNSIYMFIQKCMDPARGLVDEEKYAKRRMETNKILMLKGIEIDDGGNFRTVQKAQGVSEVTRRTRELSICRSRCLSPYNFCTCLCINLLTCCLSCITHTINAFFKIFSAYFSTDYNVALLFKFTVNLSHKLVCC